MRRVRILTHSIRNFQGIRDLTLHFEGEDGWIYGANGAGKTTILSSFTWLLFEKDSLGRKDFAIKPLDVHHQVISGLNPEVECVLDVDGNIVVLRKVYSEKWVKRRGSPTAEFSGHTTDYYLDGVPVQQKDYKSAVSEIADEDLFRLLTDPVHFNARLDWQTRRKILIEVCGDIADADILATRNDLAPLTEILGRRSIEDHRKVIASRRKEINSKLADIPVRIDEAQKSKPDTKGGDESAAREAVASLRMRIEALEAELTRLQTGGQVAVLAAKIAEADAAILAEKNRMEEESAEERRLLRLKLEDAESAVRKSADELNELRAKKSELPAKMTAQQAEVERLRSKWQDAHAESLVYIAQDACVVCGQALPPEKVQSARKKAQEDFNLQKSERLERLKSDGMAAAAQLQELQTTLQHMGDSVQRVKLEGDAAAAEVERVKAELQSLQPEPTPKLRQLQAQKVALEKDLTEYRSSSLSAVEKTRYELMDLRDELRRAESTAASFDQVRKLDERIASLKAEERSLAAEFERMEHELYLTEAFTRAKVSALTDRINHRFRVARFVLFEPQVNGGLTETCVTMVDGVPYGQGLNHAAGIQVGLDIIRTLSEHHGVWMPVLIDGRESVSSIPDMDTQVISLIVSPGDPVLRHERTERSAPESLLATAETTLF